MQNKKVIKLNNLPAKMPIYQTLTTAMALDYWHAPQWLCGAVAFLFILIWISCFYSMATTEKIDLFNTKTK